MGRLRKRRLVGLRAVIASSEGEAGLTGFLGESREGRAAAGQGLAERLSLTCRGPAKFLNSNTVKAVPWSARSGARRRMGPPEARSDRRDLDHKRTSHGRQRRRPIQLAQSTSRVRRRDRSVRRHRPGRQPFDTTAPPLRSRARVRPRAETARRPARLGLRLLFSSMDWPFQRASWVVSNAPVAVLQCSSEFSLKYSTCARRRSPR
jgi:hypothetical protein